MVRSLIKRPEVLVINEALSAHDRETRDRIRRQLYVLLPTTTLIWIDSEMPDASEFDQVLVLRNGRIEERISEATPVEADTKAVDTSTVQDADGGTILNAEISALGQVPLFSEMDASRLKLLAFTSERLTYSKGEDLFHQGDTGNAAYVILEGAVDIIVGEGDEEIIVSHLDKNELVGDMALPKHQTAFRNRPRTFGRHSLGAQERTVPGTVGRQPTIRRAYRARDERPTL